MCKLICIINLYLLILPWSIITISNYQYLVIYHIFQIASLLKKKKFLIGIYHIEIEYSVDIFF